jgi:hypothetical protein
MTFKEALKEENIEAMGAVVMGIIGLIMVFVFVTIYLGW